MGNGKFGRFRMVAILLALATTAAACGGDDDDDADAPTTSGDPAAVEPIDVRFVASSPGLASADLWVARYGGYFEDEGLNVTWGEYTNNGALAANAPTTDADISSTALSSTVAAIAEGRPLVMFGASAHGGATGVITLSTEVVERLEAEGITPESPVDERLRALEGLTIGVSGAVESLLRSALLEVDLDPDSDVTLQSMDLTTMAPTLSAGAIDGFMISPPHSVIPEAEGFGRMWICGPCGDVPTWNRGVYIVFVASRSTAEENPEMLRRFIAAMDKASQFLRDNPDEAAEIVREQYPDLDEEVLALSMEAVAGAFQGPEVTEEQIEEAIDLYNEQADSPVDVEPADVWWPETLG